MTPDDINLHIFYLALRQSLPAISGHSQAKLYLSELVTIGILWRLFPSFPSLAGTQLWRLVW